MKKISVITEDGIKLVAQNFEHDCAKAVVLINPGTATKTRFYETFARYIQQQGYHVITWNYRGFDESKQGHLAKHDHAFSDLGRYDIPAMITTCKELYPSLPLFCIGHSAGGQQLGAAHNHDQVELLIAIATSSGYFGHMPLGYRLKAYFFFYLFAPISIALTGYVASSRFHFMEDLPKRLTIQWRKWCKQPGYFFTDSDFGKSIPSYTYQSFSAPTYILTADDDEISTTRNVESFWKHTKLLGPKTQINYQAKDFPRKMIGHFGYFRPENRKIWEDISDILSHHAGR